MSSSAVILELVLMRVCLPYSRVMSQNSQLKGQPRECWIDREAYFFVFIRSQRGRGVSARSAHFFVE